MTTAKALQHSATNNLGAQTVRNWHKALAFRSLGGLSSLHSTGVGASTTGRRILHLFSKNCKPWNPFRANDILLRHFNFVNASCMGVPVWKILKVRVQVLLVNGPGTCAPVCAIAVELCFSSCTLRNLLIELDWC